MPLKKVDLVYTRYMFYKQVQALQIKSSRYVFLTNKSSLNVVKTEFILIGSAKKLSSLVEQPNLKLDMAT